MDSFDVMLALVIGNPDSLTVTNPERERENLGFLEEGKLGAALLAMPISQRATDLIIACEITNDQIYNRRYVHPTWPGGMSGVTVGIGYDLGYVSAQQLALDWAGNLSVADISALSRVCGVQGTEADRLVSQVSTVSVPLPAARKVFQNSTLSKTTSLTVSSLPNCDKLSPDCLGALVSLVYNRGPSFRKAGDRYAEMRQILFDMNTMSFADIPTQIRSMARLWVNDPGARGLVTRRELEATLFHDGLPKV